MDELREGRAGRHGVVGWVGTVGWSVAAAALLACSTRTTNLASSRSSETDAGVLPDASAGFAFDDAGMVQCGSSTCACSDGLDNDRDGLVDGFDPECTGAFDAHEDSFATGAHGEGQNGKCQDCYFDDNSGRDACSRPRSCASDPTDSSSGNGSCRSCSVDEACSDTCAALVPNGCDCFGCCGVHRGSVVKNVLLGSTSCNVDTLDEPSACTACVPSSECANPCGTCELCPGRTVSDLPAECASSYACDESQRCASSTDCAGFAYCQSGCCLAVGI